MKLVLDTNTVVSGFLWREAPRHLLDAAVEGRITLATSTVLIDELAEVIGRAKFARKIAEQGLSVGALLDRYTKLASRVTPARIRRVVRRPMPMMIMCLPAPSQHKPIGLFPVTRIYLI